jgi:hypothetical protein
VEARKKVREGEGESERKSESESENKRESESESERGKVLASKKKSNRENERAFIHFLFPLTSPLCKRLQGG